MINKETHPELLQLLRAIWEYQDTLIHRTKEIITSDALPELLLKIVELHKLGTDMIEYEKTCWPNRVKANSSLLPSKSEEHIVQFPDGRLDNNNAALYLGLSTKTLAMWRSHGKGPKFIKRGRIFYYREDLEAWIKEKSVKRNSTSDVK